MTRQLSRPQQWTVAVLACIAAIAGAALYALPTMQSSLNIYDEGIILVGASRVMRGELPYRDFWTQYSPGQFYTLASLFALTGKSVMAARWWDVLTRALLAVALYVLAAQSAGWKRAWVVWPLAVIWLTFYGFFSYPIFQGLLFSCLSLAAFLRGLTAPRWMIVSGLAFGAAFAFRHDMAIYLAAAMVLTSAAYALSGRIPAAELLRRMRPLAIAAAVLIVPIVAVFGAQVAPDQLLQQLFLFPLLEFPKYRDLPYPTFTGAPDTLPFYAPLLIYALAAGLALWRMRQRDVLLAPDHARATAMLALALFGVFGFNQARVRSDLIHTVHFWMLALALLPALWPQRAPVGARFSVARYAVGMLSITLTLAALIEPLDFYFKLINRRDPAGLAKRAEASPALARGIPLEDWQQSMLASLRFYAKPEDTVYIGLKRHDKVFANDVMSYFLFDRPIPTRFHEIHPGVVNTVAVQHEMIEGLSRAKPKLLFLTDMFEGASEPNLSSESSDVKLLDAYLREHYRAFSSAGPFTIYRLKEAK